MAAKTPLLASQRVVQVCLFLVSAIALFGGPLQMYLGQQKTLVFLIALSVFLAGTGRLVSISLVGLPQPNALWLGYLLPELLVPWIMVIAQLLTNKRSAASMK